MTDKPKIPFFNYPALYSERENEYLSIMTDVCKRGAYILQCDLEEFENNLSKYLNAKYVYGVANGTDAIWLGLMAVGIGPGDEVILPSHTYIATAAAVHFVGAIPVLAEIGSDHMLDPDSVEDLITSRTKAILPVQINGRTCDMSRIQAIADKHGLFIVEDSAQGLGSKYDGQMAGTFGKFGTSSFYPAKLLGCFGDGGAVFTNDQSVAEKLVLLRDHGRHPDTGKVVAWGFNSRLDNLQAAILNYKLQSFEEDVERRRAIARQYDVSLRDVNEIDLPPGPDEDTPHFDVYQNYELQAERRDELREYLANEGIHTIIQWGGTPVHQFKELGFNDVNLPRTDKFFQRCLMLPMNTTLTDSEVDYICQKIRNFYGYDG